MTGPPRAMEEEDEYPDELEEEEDDPDNRENSAGLDEEDGGFVSQRRLGPYVTRRTPGIRSIYTISGRARHGRRQIPVSSNGGCRNPYQRCRPRERVCLWVRIQLPKEERSVNTRPPASTGSRKRKGAS